MQYSQQVLKLLYAASLGTVGYCYLAKNTRLLLRILNILSKRAHVPTNKVIANSNDRPRNPLYSNNLHIDFRITEPSRLLDSLKAKPAKPRRFSLTSNRKDLPNVWELFVSYTRVNISSGPRIYNAHPSFFSFFIQHGKGGVTIMSMSKLFTR